MAEAIAYRIFEIEISDSVEYLIKHSKSRCHHLKGDRKGEYAMDLIHPYRLVFEKEENRITLVRIISIEDYH